MNKITEEIIWRFGKTGLYVYSVIIGVVNLLPLIILGAPVWVIVLVAAALWFVPLLQFPYLGVWIWAFVVALKLPITWMSIVFFAAFALYFGYMAFALFKKDNRS